MIESKQYPSIHLGSPGEEISKKDLHTITQRFKNLNQIRLQRAQGFLLPKQQAFLSLLALLFQTNNPLLPGYISSKTPAGIPDYKPNKQTILAAKKIAKSFRYKRRAMLSHPIQGIFIMGSVSSIAFSKASDIDVWLCHDPDLSPPDVNKLQQKATSIEKWALTYQLEVHFFLINSQQFSQGQHSPISLESSGNTQHYILLEEFYRTAIFIAGRIPAWWLVPPHQETNYTHYVHHLINKRFISANEIIDFGGLAVIPAEEFINATLWHLFKSLNYPHKSLLKLFLMESYASEFPQPEWLCFVLKKAIYQGSFNIDALDPYLLIYAKVERYLKKTAPEERLTLARQCFYLKIMGTTNQKPVHQTRAIRSNYMASIASQWHWPENLLANFQKQKNWNIQKATQEHLIIRKQLKHCLRTVLNLASSFIDYDHRDNDDLKLIHRQLHVFLERKPNKIEIITTRSTVHVKENKLSIIESPRKDTISSWVLYAGEFDHKRPASHLFIKKERSLLSLLGWLIINGLYQKQLQLLFESHSLQLSKNDLHRVLAKLSAFLHSNLVKNSSSLTVLNKANKQRASLIFINLGVTLTEPRDDGFIAISDRSDPLSYGKDRHCFIQQVDQISVSNWGEVTTAQFIGVTEFFNCLMTIFNLSQPPHSMSKLTTLCFTPNRGNSITLRVESIFKNFLRFFNQQSLAGNCRYILRGAYTFYVFQNKNNHLSFSSLASEEQLLQELATAQPTFSPVFYDPEVLEDSLVPFLYSMNKARIIQVFYYLENHTTIIYIIDEKGALFIQKHKKSNNNQLLDHYSIFLESLLAQPFANDALQLMYYEIQKKSVRVFSAKPVKRIPSTTKMGLQLKIIIKKTALTTQSSPSYIYCNDIEFSAMTYGDQLFKVVFNYIMDFRKYAENYPVYISEIDAPAAYLGAEDNSALQTIHYLKLKKKTEAKFNLNDCD